MKTNYQFANYDSVKNLKSDDNIFLAGGTADFLPVNYEIDSKYTEFLCKYEDTHGAKNLIETYMSKELKYDFISEKNVLPTSGSTSGIYAALSLVCNENDEVIIFMPCWSIYIKTCQDLKLNVVKLFPNDINNISYSIDEITKKITNKTKAILFASPINPTGNLMDKEIKKCLLQISKENDIYLLVDETYYGMEYKEKESIIELCDFKEDLNHMIIIRSLSKYYCMPGLRVGFLISSENNIENIHNILRNMYLSVSNLSQQIANSIINKLCDSNWHKDICLSNLNKFLELSKKYSVLQIIVPESAFFVCFKVAKEENIYYSTKELYEQTKLVFRDCGEFGLEEYSRMNLCIDKDKFKVALERMENLLNL